MKTNSKIFEVPDDKSFTYDLQAKKGEEFTIKFRGNATTGYAWCLENSEELDKNLIEPLNLNQQKSGDYQVDQHQPMMVGVGGAYLFTFRANGSTDNLKLTFKHKRPWEDKHIRKVDVNVKLE